MTETDPLAHWPDRTPLYDDGRLLLVSTIAEGTRTGRVWADGVWRPASTPASSTAAAILEAMAGYAVSTSDEELVALLLDAGATRERHAHVMSHALSDIPDSPTIDGLVVALLDADQLDAIADQLGYISNAAYPAEHPDHEHPDTAHVVDELRAISRGELLGPYLGNASTLATTDGRAIGACLVVDREGVAPDGGPWIIDVFRDPSSTVKAVGRSLLIGSLEATRAAGLPSLSLAVSHENANAVALYTALGFVDHGQSWTLAIP